MKEKVEILWLLWTKNEEERYDIRGFVDPDDRPTVVSSGVEELKSVEHEPRATSFELSKYLVVRFFRRPC